MSKRFRVGWVPPERKAPAGLLLRRLRFAVPDLTPAVAGLLGVVVASVAMALGII